MAAVKILLLLLAAACCAEAARILAVFGSKGHSHAMVSRPLLRALAARGHDVHVYWHDLDLPADHLLRSSPLIRSIILLSVISTAACTPAPKPYVECSTIGCTSSFVEYTP